MKEMNILKGVYDPSFVGDSQHTTATHIVKEASTFWDKVEHVRRDIRAFIATNDIDGHTSIIWSASVERPADVNFATADSLLQTILTNDSQCDISPSIMYAAAAGLEGCSFIHGGSQNTLSLGMYQLFEARYRSGDSQILQKFFDKVSKGHAYILGTDFKAGQTKFKTAAVEYIRASGLTPKVIASFNHLGNNDMLNLTSKKTVEAKMRVKSNIFGPWEENDLDHQVRVMYTPFMLDEKRDVVEYTSLGFLDCVPTMLTFTRCMDSILCVPLMIDAAVWCEFFARHSSPSSRMAKATSYLFKVPEGGAIGVDPGFQRQITELEMALRETTLTSGAVIDTVSSLIKAALAVGIITSEQAERMRDLI